MRFALFGNIYQTKKSASIQKVLSCLSEHGAELYVDMEYYYFLKDNQRIDVNAAKIFTDDDFQKNVEHFSGGQKTRICLAKALLREPDFLFLDEPTNHLDIGMIEWLEGFLRTYRGGVLIISHDRYFLDKVATRMVELENHTVTSYEGNYTYFMRVKTARREALKSAYEKQQEHIKKTEEYIRKYKMQYAERLMMEGKYTISEVAYMSGFNSINYFRRCFKEEFGDVPSDYLKKLKTVSSGPR